MALLRAGVLHHASIPPLVVGPAHRPPIFHRVSLPVTICEKWTAKKKAHRGFSQLKCSSQSPAGSLTTAEKEDGEEEDMSKTTLIWRAAKLPIYSVAVVPLTVGSAAAYYQTGFFSARRYLLPFFASILIIAWINLSNDVYDYDTGADRDKKESVVNIINSRTVTHYAAIISLVLGFMGLCWACAETGDIRSILLATFAILCGFVYQCPPFRLGYLGLGEPLCFASFGPFATTASYFSQSTKIPSYRLPLNGAVLCASVLVGLTTTFILFCSHFHQIDGDAAVGKMSPLVRIGTERGSKVIRFGILLLYILLFTFSACKFLPLTCGVLCAITIPIAKLVMNFLEKNHNNKSKIFMAKYYCVRLHCLFGAAMAAGFVVARGGFRLIS